MNIQENGRIVKDTAKECSRLKIDANTQAAILKDSNKALVYGNGLMEVIIKETGSKIRGMEMVQFTK